SRAPLVPQRQLRGSGRAAPRPSAAAGKFFSVFGHPRKARATRVTLGAMFDIGLQEMLVIGVLALLVFGPSKLPELGRMVGRALREFRRASDEFRSTVETNLHINEPDPPPVSSYASTPSEAAPTLPSETASIAVFFCLPSSTPVEYRSQPRRGHARADRQAARGPRLHPHVRREARRAAHRPRDRRPLQGDAAGGVRPPAGARAQGRAAA